MTLAENRNYSDYALKWLAEEYPTIQRMAKQQGADIFFTDEAGMEQCETSSHRQKSSEWSGTSLKDGIGSDLKEFLKTSVC